MNRHALTQQVRIADNTRYINIYLEGLQRCLEDMISLTPTGDAKEAILMANARLYEAAKFIELWKGIANKP